MGVGLVDDVGVERGTVLTHDGSTPAEHFGIGGHVGGRPQVADEDILQSRTAREQGTHVGDIAGVEVGKVERGEL